MSYAWKISEILSIQVLRSKYFGFRHWSMESTIGKIFVLIDCTYDLSGNYIIFRFSPISISIIRIPYKFYYDSNYHFSLYLKNLAENKERFFSYGVVWNWIPPLVVVDIHHSLKWPIICNQEISRALYMAFKFKRQNERQLKNIIPFFHINIPFLYKNGFLIEKYY